MNWAETVHILLFHMTSTSNLLIQGIHGYFKTTLILTLTALTDPKLAWQNELPVFHRHVHSQFCQDGSAVPTLQGVLHMEACWQKPTGLQLNLTGWSLWGGSMIVTSSLDSARGLFSDYGRARCTDGGATAASIKADTMRELQRGRSRLCGAGKLQTTGPAAAVRL